MLSYGPNASLKYSGSSAQTTTDVEFPSFDGPKNLIIANSRGVTLHASRIIGNLDLSGKLKLGTNTLTANSTSDGTSLVFVVTTDGGALKLTSVGSSPKLFPVGTTAYAPVWITNSGTIDTISVGVIKDTDNAPYGGRVRVKWNISENTAGGGDYTLQFGWVNSLEETAFRADRANNARIFYMADTTEAGTGNYTTQFITQPYTVSRAGITTLGPFAVGRFRDVTGIAGQTENVPAEFRLSQNYPNPFNPTTTINYFIAKESFVQLKIYDILGREIKTLVNEQMPAGKHSVRFDATDLSSGIYFYQIKAGDFSQSKKMILIR
jgi:hypothetical protein